MSWLKAAAGIETSRTEQIVSVHTASRPTHEMWPTSSAGRIRTPRLAENIGRTCCLESVCPPRADVLVEGRGDQEVLVKDLR